MTQTRKLVKSGIIAIDDQPGKVQTVRDPALIRNLFMKGLGTGRGGALDV